MLYPWADLEGAHRPCPAPPPPPPPPPTPIPTLQKKKKKIITILYKGFKI